MGMVPVVRPHLYTALAEFCAEHDVRQGFIPMFIAGMRDVRHVGTCEKLENPDAPVWSAVHLENVEAIGCGTLAYDEETQSVLRTSTSRSASRPTPRPHIPVIFSARRSNSLQRCTWWKSRLRPSRVSVSSSCSTSRCSPSSPRTKSLHSLQAVL
jgi:hypothetical protein